MKESAIDTINFMSTIQLIKENQLLTNAEKSTLFKELKTSLPPLILCSHFVSTREIMELLIDKEIADVEPKKAQKKASAKAQEKHSSEEKLLRGTGKNARGSSTKKRVVN
tara:strand:+ start:693 stop:1022 length:330 start_codon:yes stop_codon:yes gene_type:complete